MPNRLARRIVTTLFLLAPLLAGCGTVVRLPPPSAQPGVHAQLLGIPNARFWLDADDEALRAEARLVAAREAAERGNSEPAPPARFLALSGGADNGAFGAGLMVGWTAAGDRPSFNVVTGISAGGLIAPFAFLGPTYDAQLQDVFTNVAPEDVMRTRRILSILFSGAALVDASPLARLIERHADEAMLAAIAAEYRRGRLLLIGTTNLDLQRPVVWNIGAIADSGHPGALTLFRQILLASASIPGAFPPVLIDVEMNGRRYQEMHVDGGVSTMVFLWPPFLDLPRAIGAAAAARQRIAYVVRNGRMDVEADPAFGGLFGIARRSLGTLLHFSSIGDINRIYLTALRDRVQFRLAFISSDFNAPRGGPFDTAYMRALYDYGFGLARNGYPWAVSPPGVGTMVPAESRQPTAQRGPSAGTQRTGLAPAADVAVLRQP